VLEVSLTNKTNTSALKVTQKHHQHKLTTYNTMQYSFTSVADRQLRKWHKIW